jgi:GR25 family glycosyltransferase involved in LPS biosynthesis
MLNIQSVVINLDDRQDRLDQFYQQFAATEYRPIRLPAVSGENIKSSNFVPKNVEACWNSHLNAYELLLKSEDNHLIIFEDDAVLSKDGFEFIERLNSDNLKGIDILQFGFLTHKGKIDFPQYDKNSIILNLSTLLGKGLARYNLIFRTWIRITRFIVRNFPFEILNNYKTECRNEFFLRKKLNSNSPLIFQSFEPGTHAYVISRNMAKFFLECNKPTYLAADLFLMGFSAAGNSISIRLSKSICNQNNSPSSIVNRFNWESR